MLRVFASHIPVNSKCGFLQRQRHQAKDGVGKPTVADTILTVP
jgi:hypothetical protein